VEGEIGALRISRTFAAAKAPVGSSNRFSRVRISELGFANPGSSTIAIASST
jgi:hypothetical protein